jgi:hypothetical protein
VQSTKKVRRSQTQQVWTPNFKQSKIRIWGFPEMGIPRNHPF